MTNVLTCPVEVAQFDSELALLIKAFERVKARTVVEIGSLYGGTLWHMASRAHEGTKFVSIDKIVSISDERHYRQLYSHSLFQSWQRQFNVSIFEILARSQDAETVEIVKSMFIEGIDFLFIDGDHSVDGVRKDFELYSPLVRDNGAIAFHDIAYNIDSEYYGVRPLWQRIKDDIRSHSSRFKEFDELVEHVAERGMGIVYT